MKYIFWFFWRIWFYILIMIPIIILSPILLILVSSEKTYPQFFRVARFWGKFVLWGMGFYYKIDFEQPLEKEKSYMLIANHTSMTDIMLMLAVVKHNRVCIMVDRSSSKSRYQVFERAQKRLQQGLSICIFPEGGVPDDESIILDEFKDGAFRLAIEHQIPIIPMSFIDNKKRFPFRFFSGKPGRMRVKVHAAIPTEGFTLENKQQIKEQARTVILNDLKH
ncbi:MAG: 1-acyl-sn-glycerol-3-phosphate acyltransferase [Flavobacteriaceae bacterium]|nr:1-acyl-sn-glycerol-3-phosphate acyltransferase [Flavobacteriaceae bacterium]